MSKISKWGMTINAIVAISLIFNVSICAYLTLDDIGWISHDHHTPVLVKGEWLTGEYRVCLMPGGVSLPNSARLVCPQYLSGLSGDEMQAFFAHNWDAFAEPFHDIPVTYEGRIDRTDRGLHDGYAWQCVRQEGIIHNISLSCRALN